MFFKTTKPKLQDYNIPLTDENHSLLRKAKSAIAESSPEHVLELLSSLKLKDLDIEITALSARLAYLERTNRLGTVSYEAKTIEQNKINESLTLLITALEKEIAQSFEFYTRIKEALTTHYETCLSQKLSNLQLANLRLVPSTIGTTPCAASTFVQYSEGQIREKLVEYYEDANGRLLLVGVPGAGKTTLLLQFELELLKQETTRIPVILNLARWSDKFRSLEAWIQEVLPLEIGLILNNKTAADLVTQNQLILLLDGLDEVKEEWRQACLEAIGVYGENPHRYFIISSCIDEYKLIAKDAPVNVQVEVDALTDEQLIEQLEKTGQNEGSKRLLAALKNDKLLPKIAKVPFYFNALQLLFAQGKYLHEFNFSAIDIEGRKKEIELCFVTEMFRKVNSREYDAQSITKYLGFFASRLKRENIVDFELTHLQYNWKKTSKWDAKIGKILEGLVIGLNSGLALGLVGGLGLGLVGGLSFGLVGALGGGLGLGLIGGLLGGLAGGLGGGLGLGLAGGLGLGLGLSLIVGQGVGLSLGLAFGGLVVIMERGLPIISTRENIKWNWKIFMRIKNLVGGLIGGLGLGLIEGLDVGLGIGLMLGLGLGIIDQLENHNSFKPINNPYERFKASAKVLYFSILQHWHLRHLLHKKGLLPKKLVPFLNDMVKCNILETTGASWRFRHRILQDYFADQWVETEFEPEQK